MTPKQLKKWRKDHKLTRPALAGLLDVHKMTIYKWENKLQPIPKLLDLALAELHRRVSAETESDSA